MKTTHTPGPWKITTDTRGDLHISHESEPDSQGWSTLHPVVDDLWANNEANARLIAAAPDMLEALNIAWDNLSQLYSKDHFVIRTINAAIAKAKGE